MTELNIDVSHDTSHNVPVTIFTLEGEIDASSYEQLQATAQEAYQDGTRYLLLDLAEVPYVSSAGLRALHNIFTLLRSEESAESNDAMRQGVRDGSFKSEHLKLLNPTPAVQDVLKTAGFDMYLAMYQDREQALAAFG